MEPWWKGKGNDKRGEGPRNFAVFVLLALMRLGECSAHQSSKLFALPFPLACVTLGLPFKSRPRRDISGDLSVSCAQTVLSCSSSGRRLPFQARVAFTLLLAR